MSKDFRFEPMPVIERDKKAVAALEAERAKARRKLEELGIDARFSKTKYRSGSDVAKRFEAEYARIVRAKAKPAGSNITPIQPLDGGIMAAKHNFNTKGERQ